METLQLTGADVIIIAILVISNFAVFIIFRVMGKDYDAATNTVVLQKASFVKSSPHVAPDCRP